MALGVKTIWYYTISTILVILSTKLPHVQSAPQVPCYFIFGDSLLDNGNNNFLLTYAKGNYLPYGIDFPDGPTGRFTNGRTVADIIAEYLGFDKYIPNFFTANGREILSGVNYASGGAGIRDDTGRQQGDVSSFNRQLLQHEITVARIAFLLGSKKSADKHLSTCLYLVEMGNNDYINNYFIPSYYSSRNLSSPDQYARDLIQKFSLQLRTLYALGARKVAVFGLSKISMIPEAKTIKYYKDDRAVRLFDRRIKPLLTDLNRNLLDAKFIHASSTSVTTSDFSAAGIKVFNAPCCKVSSRGLCRSGGVPCRNRSAYLFWDAFHPTDAVNVMFASRAYNGSSPADAYPFGIKRLVQL